VEAIQSGQILGAGLDVLEFEKSSFETLFQENATEIPADFKALLAMPNVLLSPHVAGWTHESHLKLAQVIVAKIKQKYSA
jgi:D-3-phosphoglycerate dehydrogenase